MIASLLAEIDLSLAVLVNFSPILPAFCLLLSYSYYSNNFAGEIDGSLIASYTFIASVITVFHHCSIDLEIYTYSIIQKVNTCLALRQKGVGYSIGVL